MVSWLRQTMNVTRGGFLATCSCLGLLAGGGVLLGSIALDDIREERTRAIAEARLTDQDIQRIAVRVWKLERPTRAEDLRKFGRQLRRCLSSESCVDRLGQVTQAIDTGQLPDRQVSPPATQPPRRDSSSGNGGVQAPQGRPRADVPRPSDPGGPDPPDPSPPQPPAPVELDLPDVGPIEIPSVCTGVVDVNC